MTLPAGKQPVGSASVFGEKSRFWLDFVVAICETTRYTVYCVEERRRTV